jgi:hypothetical protein
VRGPGGARACRPVCASRLQACIAPTSRALAGRQATPMSWAVKNANQGVSGQQIPRPGSGWRAAPRPRWYRPKGKEPARRALPGRPGSAGRRAEPGTRRLEPSVTGSTPGSATAAGHQRLATRVDEPVDRMQALRQQTKRQADPLAEPLGGQPRRPDRKPGAPRRDPRADGHRKGDEVVMVAAGGLPGLLGEGAAARAGRIPDRPEPRRWSGHPGGLARPAPPQPLEPRERALVQRLERPRRVAAEQALRSTTRGALDPPRGAGRGGVHPLQPGPAVHPRAP